MPDLSSIRVWQLFFGDLLVTALSIAGAMILRFDTLRLEQEALIYFPAALLPLVLRPPVNILFGLYSRAWAYASVGELARIALAVVAGSALIVVVFYAVLVPWEVPGTITPLGRFPRSFFVLEGLLTLAGYGSHRFLIRASTEWRGWMPGGRSRRMHPSGRISTLVYGAGDAGAMTLRTLSQARDGLGMVVVGLIDDNRAKRNQVLRGTKVLGSISELSDIARVTGARRLLIAIPAAPGDVIRRATEEATRLGLEVRTVPALDDLVSGRLSAAAIREVRVDDLLRRDPVIIDETSLRGLVARKTVLVTGAGGSIGSELARQVFDLDPARLVLLDRAEGPLHDIDRELALLADRDSGTPTRSGRSRATLSLRLANAASPVAMRAIVDAERPVLILHAAAYKHVPMMELHPADAAYTNIGATLAALDAAAATDVERFVLVSTDKAVRPTSVMGMTKRLAELAVADAGLRTGRRFVSVRFGNVLGSSGSVVPLFQRQLAEGVPLTITDPAMERYFMTIPEAARLILEAALLGEPGDLFVLDMGAPVKIVDLARDLARLAGRDPDSVPMRYIGLRPGEKLSEELFYDQRSVVPTAHPKVLRSRGELAFVPGLRERLDALVALASEGYHDAVREDLREIMAAVERASPPPVVAG
jgi:FlaA1/EpsC-like NDP-sugar epimerase